MSFRRSASEKSSQAIDTVRLDKSQRDCLIKSLDQKRSRKRGNNARRWPRFKYDAEHIIVRITHVGGTVHNYLVVPRNLSVGGVAFIHGQFIHPDSRCEVVLPTPKASWFRVGGRVVRCLHASGMIHEVSVEFEERIDPHMFLRPEAPIDETPPGAEGGDAEPERANDRAGKKVRGTVLLVDAETTGRALYGKWLRQRGMLVLDASDGDTAIKWLEDGRAFDLAVIHTYRVDAAITDMVQRVRGRGFKGPIVAISADNTDEARAKAQAVGCNAFLPKPCSTASLFGAIDQLLAADSTDRPAGAERPAPAP